MIRWWVNLLPFGFVAWYVCRYCQTTGIGSFVARKATDRYWVATMKTDNHDRLVTYAIRAIAAVANDCSVSPDVNVASLRKLQEECELRICAVKENDET